MSLAPSVTWLHIFRVVERGPFRAAAAARALAECVMQTLSVVLQRCRLKRFRLRAVGVLVVCASQSAFAQTSANLRINTVVSGSVRDSAGMAIAGADVMIDGTRLRAVTSDDGGFRLVGMTEGLEFVSVRRLGFRPMTMSVDVQLGTVTRVVLTLARVQVILPTVVVTNMNVMRDPTRGMSDRRNKSGGGHYFSRADIDAVRPQVMTDLIRRVPGARVAAVGNTRNAIRFRGAKCPPLVWLDGLPLGSSEFDIDALSTGSVEAIEVYSGFASIPAQFTMSLSLKQQCGAILVWSRQGEGTPRRRKNNSAASDLAVMVEELAVFSAEQVDIQARHDSVGFVQPAYPDSLLRLRAGGDVLAEFVVDTMGRVLMEHFSIISSSHPAFSAAVEKAVQDARFNPARKEGRKVRQAVQWPFRFRALTGEAVAAGKKV